MSSRPIPPAPSFAEFKFNTIGQQPVLLKRFSAPDQAFRSSPSPSPAQQRPILPSDTARAPISLSRPTLLQALGDQPLVARSPVLTIKTDSMVVDDPIPKVVDEALLHMEGPDQAATLVPGAHVTHESTSHSQVGDIGPPFTGTANLTNEQTRQNTDQAHITSDATANVVHAPRPHLPLNEYDSHLSQLLADDTTLVDPPTLLYPQSVEPTTPIPSSPSASPSPPSPGTDAPSTEFSCATLRHIHSRLSSSLTNISPLNTRIVLRQVQAADNHSAKSLAAAHRTQALVQQCLAIVQEALAGSNECMTSAEQSRNCINDALGAVEEISFGNGGEHSKEWEYKQRISEMKGDLRLASDWVSEREAQESRAKMKKEKKKMTKKVKRLSGPDVRGAPSDAIHGPGADTPRHEWDSERNAGTQSSQVAPLKDGDVHMSDESDQREAPANVDSSGPADNLTPRNEASASQQSNTYQTPVVTNIIAPPPISIIQRSTHSSQSPLDRQQDTTFSRQRVLAESLEKDKELWSQIQEEQQVKAAAAAKETARVLALREELERRKAHEQEVLNRERDTELAKQKANDEIARQLAHEQRARAAAAKAKEDALREREKLEREKACVEQEANRKREAEISKAAAQAEAQRKADETIAKRLADEQAAKSRAALIQAEEQERKRQEISDGKRRAITEEATRILAERAQDRQITQPVPPPSTPPPTTQQLERQAFTSSAVPFGNLVARSTLISSTPMRMKTHSPEKNHTAARALSRVPGIVPDGDSVPNPHTSSDNSAPNHIAHQGINDTSPPKNTPSSTQNHDISREISLPPIVHIPAREPPKTADTPPASVFRQSRDAGNIPVASRPQLSESAQREQAFNLRFLMDATGISLGSHMNKAVNVKQEAKEDNQLLQGQGSLLPSPAVLSTQEPARPDRPISEVQSAAPLPTGSMNDHTRAIAQTRPMPTRPRHTNEDTPPGVAAETYLNQPSLSTNMEATRQPLDSRVLGINEQVTQSQPSNPYPRADRFSPIQSSSYPTTGQKRYRDYEDPSQPPPAFRSREAMSDRPRARRTPSPPPARHSSWYARRSPTPERPPLASRLAPQDYTTRRMGRGDSYRPSYSSLIERRSPSPVLAPPRRRNPAPEPRPELLDRFSDYPVNPMNLQPPIAPRSQVTGNSRGAGSVRPLEQRISSKPLMNRLDDGPV